MHLTYLLPSPTFGMHQYAADLANRAVTGDWGAGRRGQSAPGYDVHLVTTTGYPADRYHPAVRVQTPIASRGTGLSGDSADLGALRRLATAVHRTRPDVVHITGPHLWNPLLLLALRRRRIPTIHTLHDLDPHTGTSRLLHLWNGLILRLADVVLVHGRCYRDRLLAQGRPAERIAYLPLLHLFVGYRSPATERPATNGAGLAHGRPATNGRSLAHDGSLANGGPARARRAAVIAHPPDPPSPTAAAATVLFFGRLAPYKGVGDLLAAWQRLALPPGQARLVLAGAGRPDAVWPGPLPPGVVWRSGRIDDETALTLFEECALVALPYSDATQSALIPAAYYFGKPVVASRAGALPEYVEDGVTGFLVPPRDPVALAQTLAVALANPGRLAAMGQAGRAWYEQHRAAESSALRALYQAWGQRPLYRAPYTVRRMV